MSNYAEQERAKWWPVPAELMAQYRDGSHTHKDRYGHLAWLKNDKLHRDGDLPAFIDADGTLWWYQNDQWHRDGDRPAIIWANGSLGWCKNNQWHRVGDLPAIIKADGGLYWYQNSLKHRSCGPSVICPSGKLEWWWRGEYIPVNSQEEFVEYLTLHRLIESEAL